MTNDKQQTLSEPCTLPCLVKLGYSLYHHVGYCTTVLGLQPLLELVCSARARSFYHSGVFKGVVGQD